MLNFYEGLREENAQYRNEDGKQMSFAKENTETDVLRARKGKYRNGVSTGAPCVRVQERGTRDMSHDRAWSVRRRRQSDTRAPCHVRLSIKLANANSSVLPLGRFSPPARDYPSNDESGSGDGGDLILRQSSARTSVPRRAPANGEKIFEVETKDKGPDAERLVRVKLRSGAGRPPGAMEETDAAAPFLLTGAPAVWLDTVFFPCAHVPLVTVIQFPLHLVGKNEICWLPKLLHHERGI